jgi:hypothetical protein
MRATLLLAILSAGTLSAEERMNVSVCNLGNLPESVVAGAKAETEAIFRYAEVRIEWKGCDEYRASGAADVPWFIVRLRNDKPPKSAGDSSLDAMGKAFLDREREEGYLTDANFKAVQELAERHQVDADELLGCVMAHELGHLLLGPGHVPGGIMQAHWSGNELQALRQRRLKFNHAQRERIQSELRSRSEAKETASGAET